VPGTFVLLGERQWRHAGYLQLLGGSSAMFRLAFLICLTVASANVSAVGYSFEGGHAQIVDATTREPIPNVVILATWMMQYQVSSGTAVLYTKGAKSDENGEFTLPSWGPKETARNYPGMGLSLDAPLLRAFKDGYLADGFSGYTPNPDKQFGWLGPSKRKAWFNGMTFTLQRGSPTLKQQADELAVLARWAPIGEHNCAWLDYPEWLAALQSRGKRLLKEGSLKSDWYLPLNPDFDANKCPNGKAILDASMKWFQ
jgi:hypothetical protein